MCLAQELSPRSARCGDSETEKTQSHFGQHRSRSGDTCGNANLPKALGQCVSPQNTSTATANGTSGLAVGLTQHGVQAIAHQPSDTRASWNGDEQHHRDQRVSSDETSHHDHHKQDRHRRDGIAGGDDHRIQTSACVCQHSQQTAYQGRKDRTQKG